MNRIRSFVAALLCASALGCLPAAAAADLVVVEATGVALKPGETVDGTKPLKLEQGQRVTLVSSTGKTLKLRGPYDQAPDPGIKEDSDNVLDKLRELGRSRTAVTERTGAVRSAAVERPLPEPWVLDVDRSGQRCLLENGPVVLWRADAGRAAELQIRPADRSWQTKPTTWPADTPLLKLPARLPLRDEASYEVSLGERTVTLTMHVIPARVAGDAMRAAWMVEKGCEPQAMALARGPS